MGTHLAFLPPCCQHFSVRPPDAVQLSRCTSQPGLRRSRSGRSSSTSHDLVSTGQLLNPEVLAVRTTEISRLLASRFHLSADSTPLVAGPWSDPVALPERQSLRISSRFALQAVPGTVTLEALMFPYDPQHQTFINFYESDALALQAILDTSKTSVEFFSGSRQGVWAVIRKFVPAGVQRLTAGATCSSSWSASARRNGQATRTRGERVHRRAQHHAVPAALNR